MDDLSGRRMICAVAQLPFDTVGGVVQNTFCTVLPLLLEDGARARERDFPNNGLVWWKLRAGLRPIAEPGRLLSVTLEHAPQYLPDDPNKQFYQVVPHEVGPLPADHAIEVLTAADAAFKRVADLVNVPGVLEVDHPPAGAALVRWRGALYGPVQTRVAVSAGARCRVTCTTGPAGKVLRIAEESLAQAGGSMRLESVRIAVDSTPPFRSTRVVPCTYELILGPAFDRMRGEAEELELQRDEDLIASVAKRLLTRRERQELMGLLGRLGATLGEEAEGLDAVQVIEAVRRRMRVGGSGLDELAAVLATSQELKPALDHAVAEHAAQRVESGAAELETEIRRRVAAETATLDALRAQRAELEQELEQKRQAAEAGVRERIDASWREHRRTIAEEEDALGRQKQTLIEEGGRLKNELAAVTDRFSSERDELVNHFMTMLPLLEQVFARRGTVVAEVTGGTAAVTPARPAAPPTPIELPALVTGPRTDDRPPTEVQFLDRFIHHVGRAGFAYRENDLLAFHLAMKCDRLTFVGGAPGSGKSSLPRLYAQALGGSDAACGRFASIAVRPEWASLEDMLGRVDAQARTFRPAQAGLFPLLVRAYEEHDRWGGDSGVWILCVDDLDHARPEQYLAPFIAALDRDDAPALSCFAADQVNAGDPALRWHTVRVPPSLRVAGTLVEDEAVSPVSRRLLDRGGRLQLQPAWREADPPHQRSPVPALDGPLIRLRHFSAWSRHEPLPAAMLGLLERMATPLAALDAPLAPRRLRAIERIVASSSDVTDAHNALDLALVMRVVPQLAPGYDDASADALDTLIELAAGAGNLGATRTALEALADRVERD